jgi:hypothetical protein
MTAPAPTNSAFSPRTKHLVKTFAGAGATAGLGVAALTSAMNYIQYLKQKADREKDTGYDDNVMYVDVPLDKQASVIGTGAAAATGITSALAAYMLGRKLYQKVKKKSLQSDLDDAQKVYWDKLVNEPGAVKTAAAVDASRKPVSVPELLTSSPVALTLLAGIASGVVTNKALNHYFPGSKATKLGDALGKPKSLRVRYTRDGRPIDQENPIAIGKPAPQEEETTKYASEVDFTTTEEDLRQGVVILCDIVLGMAKSASFLPDLVYAVAEGRISEIEDNVANLGVGTAFDLIKGASDQEITPAARKMSVCLLSKSDVLLPITAQIAAAEYADSCPTYVKVAAELPETDKVALLKIAAAIGASDMHSTLNGVLGDDDEDDAEDKEPLSDEDGFNEFSPHKLMEFLIGKEMQKTPAKQVHGQTTDEIDQMFDKKL